MVGLQASASLGSLLGAVPSGWPNNPLYYPNTWGAQQGQGLASTSTIGGGVYPFFQGVGQVLRGVIGYSERYTGAIRQLKQEISKEIKVD